MSEEIQILELAKEPLQKMLQRFNEDLGVFINDNQHHRLGKVLTVIDAAISDPEQRKAIKDIIRNDWWNDNGVGDSRAMVNPHTDMRGICLAFGFELYEPNTNTTPAVATDADFNRFAAKRYLKIAIEK